MIEKTGINSPIIPVRPGTPTLKSHDEKKPYDRRRRPRKDDDNDDPKKQRRGRHVDERC